MGDDNLEQVLEALFNARECIEAHSARLGDALEAEGNSEPQFASNATYACDKIDSACPIVCDLIRRAKGSEVA